MHVFLIACAQRECRFQLVLDAVVLFGNKFFLLFLRSIQTVYNIKRKLPTVTRSRKLISISDMFSFYIITIQVLVDLAYAGHIQI